MVTKFSTYGPNRSDRLALVSLNDKRPFRAYWPMRFTQIIGGRTWSLSLVRFQTPTPRLIADDPQDRTVSDAS